MHLRRGEASRGSKSSYGWKFVSSLESVEKKVGGIAISTLRAQEKAYATHVASVCGDSKWVYNDWLESASVCGS